MTPVFQDEKEFMAINQFAERPIHVLSHPGKSFEWFCMVNDVSSGSKRLLDAPILDYCRRYHCCCDHAPLALPAQPLPVVVAAYPSYRRQLRCR